MSFLFTVTIVLFEVCLSQSEKITISWKNCTASDALGTIYNVTWSPETPSVGQNFTTTGIGATSINLGNDAFYKLDVEAEGIPLGSITDNACNASYLDLDGDYGRIYYVGIPCPINKGMFTVPQIGWINPNAPVFGGVTAIATYNAYYQDPSKSVACMELDMTFS